MLALLCFAAWWRINYLRKAALEHWERQLGSIADITKIAIDGWIEERRSDTMGLAEFIGDRPALFANSRSLSLTKKREELLRRLKSTWQLSSASTAIQASG